MRISVVACNSMCNHLVDLVDAGGAAGSLEFWSGSLPGSTLSPDRSIRLVSLLLPRPAFTSAVGGTAKLSAAIPQVSVTKEGIAGYFRIKDSNGVVIFQGTVGLSNADIVVDNVIWPFGTLVSAPKLSVTVPDTV